jgi:hypothetical protein
VWICAALCSQHRLFAIIEINHAPEDVGNRSLIMPEDAQLAGITERDVGHMMGTNRSVDDDHFKLVSLPPADSVRLPGDPPRDVLI